MSSQASKSTENMDFVTNPLKLVDNSPHKTPEQWFDEYATVLSKNNTQSITSLNCTSSIGPKLVKFRGLVSDQLNPEYFLQSYTGKQKNGGEKNEAIMTGNFRECLSANAMENGGDCINIGDASTVTNQRYPMILRTVPFENDWFKKISGLCRSTLRKLTFFRFFDWTV